MQGRYDVAAGGEAVEEGVDLLIAGAAKAKVHGVPGMKRVTDHVGAHEEGGAVFREGAMEDEGALFGRHFGRHRGFGDLLELKVGFKAFLIKGEGIATLTVEIQIRIQVRHGDESFIG